MLMDTAYPNPFPPPWAAAWGDDRYGLWATFEVKGVVQRLFGEVIQNTDIGGWAKDAKTELQEWLQARRLPVPAYRIAATRGQAHAQTFEVECVVAALNLIHRGEGRSRRVAEQEAARRMLDALNATDRPGSPLRS